jgi:flagellin
MAMAASRNLGATYGMLSKSIARLSSGLRINSSADDAAGLAVREFMRSEIAVLNQGVRNANDAVSMLQTMDGAAQVIDEKLIRMKELAEQAATGTYSPAQRAIMNGEFAAMRAEIDRIAEATDFNDVKLLNGISAAAVAQKLGVTESLTDLSATTAGSAFITAFSGYAAGDQLSLSYTDNDGDTGTVSMTLKATTTITEVMAWINSTAADVRQTLNVTEDDNALDVGDRFLDAFTAYSAGNLLTLSYTNHDGTTGTASLTLKSDVTIQDVLNWINYGSQAIQTIKVTSEAVQLTTSAFVSAFTQFTVNGDLLFTYNDHNGNFATSVLAITSVGTTVQNVVDFISGLTGLNASYSAGVLTITDETGGASRLAASMGGEGFYNFSIDTAGADATTGVALTANWANGTGLTLADDQAGYSQAAASFGGGATYAFSIGTIGADATADVNLTAAWSSATGGGFTLTDVVAGVSDAAASFGGGASYAFSIETEGLAATENVKIHFGTGNVAAEDYYYVNKQDMTSSGLGIADLSIATQPSAQATIEALNGAIQLKDVSRAHFGAMMNRLANTVSNIQIQAENIQAAESQISDVDVALEMTRFVSNQIKAQAATAMLAQANTLPQLALTLLRV